MNAPQPSQDTSGRIGRRHQWLSRWWHDIPKPVLPPDPERVQTVEQALEQDAHTRWMILVVLHGTEEVDVKFMTTITHRVSTEERQRSLTWLLKTDCIAEHRHWDREFFWQPRREVLFYGITSIGTALLARIRETATAEQLGIWTEATDPLRKGHRPWLRVAYRALYVALVALSLAFIVPLLVALFTR